MFKQNELNQLALPLMFSNVFSLIIGLCDQAIIGHLSITSFALVGIIVSLINSVTGILGCITISFNIICSKYFQNRKVFRQYVGSQIILSLGLGIFSWLFFYLFGEWIFGYIYQLEGESLAESLQYVNLFSLSIGINLLLFTGSSYLKIINRTKYIFLASTISAISNVLFDVAFIYVIGLGMIGNAIGSILAMVLNLFIYVVILRNERIWDLSVFNLSLIIKIFRSSILFMIQELFEETILVLLLGVLISQIGLLEFSVYQLINSLLQIAWMPMYAYAQAILTLGSKYPKKINNLNNQALLKSMSLYCVIAIIIIYNQDFILNLITNEKNLLESCMVYLPMVFLISILNHLVVIYQYALKAIDLQLWVLWITIIIYVSFCLLIYIVNQVYTSLTVIYLGLGVVYIVISILLKYKLYLTIKNE